MGAIAARRATAGISAGRCYAPGVSDPDVTEDPDRLRRRLSTVFGWLAGGALGLLVNYALFMLVGEGYETTWTTFVLFLAGAFGGMWVADRLGPRGFKPLGIAAGLLFSIFALVVVTTLLTPGGS